MTKFLLWVVVIFVVLFGLRLLSVTKARRRAGPAGRDAPPAETMVRCVRCGVFLPPAEATPGAAGPTCKDPGCAQRN